MDCGTSGAPHRLRGTPIWLLKRAWMRAHEEIRRQLAGAGLAHQHYAVLATLAEFGPCAQAEIARRIGVDRSDMVELLNRLQAEGWVHREPDPADRRRNSVSLTAPGRAALRRFDKLAEAAGDELLAPLSEADRETLLDLLTRMMDGRREEGRS